MPLTDTRIRNAKPRDKPFKLKDAKGLHVEVRSTLAKQPPVSRDVPIRIR